MLKCLLGNHSYAKPGKNVKFLKQQSPFSAVVLALRGAQMEGVKVIAVKCWSKLGAVKDLQRHLGFSNESS